MPRQQPSCADSSNRPGRYHLARTGKPARWASLSHGGISSEIHNSSGLPECVAHYNSELAALRTSLRAKNVHRLDSIADDSKNDMAKVAALKALETIVDQADVTARPGMQQLPGLIIVNNGTAAPKVIGPAEDQVAPPIDVTPQVIAKHRESAHDRLPTASSD